MIPFADLKQQYRNIKDEIDEAVFNCLREGDYIRGKSVCQFEMNFAKYLGAGYCISCGNGTDALEIILKALRIGPGDEVIVPALTWISTAEVVNNVGAEPVFVDICEDSFTIDPGKIAEKITNRTKAVIPVHLYGCPADMTGIMRTAREFNISVIEDCAQAHGAEYHGQKTGTLGVASAFSFFPSKNLGAYGDGGAVVTNDRELSDQIRMLGNHGQLDVKHEHAVIGRNSRLDSVQASILGIKLKYLDEWNKIRRILADHYRSYLQGITGIVLPPDFEKRTHVYHLFVVRSSDRNRLIKILDENSISYGIHYPAPLPFVEAYRYKRHSVKEFPVAVKAAKEIISLPLYPELSEDQVKDICKLIRKKY